MSKKELFQLDEKIEYDRIKQFASQIDSLPHGLIKDFEKGYDGHNSMDFYHGLIAGLTAAYSASTHKPFIENNQTVDVIGAMLAFVASKFIKKIE